MRLLDLLQSDVDKMSDMIALNINALTRLTYAVAPALVARGKGTIINIASIVAFAPEVLNGVYLTRRASKKPFGTQFRTALGHANGLGT